MLTYVFFRFFFLVDTFDHFANSTGRALGQTGCIVAMVADVLIDNSEMVDNLDGFFVFMRAVTHAGTAAQAEGFAVFHSRSAEIFGAAAYAYFCTDRKQFDYVVRADTGTFATAGADVFIDMRQAIFAHCHGTKGTAAYAVAKSKAAKFTEFRALLYQLAAAQSCTPLY